MTLETHSNTFWGCKSLTSITIPEGVTSIGVYAFYGCSGLTGITIPESVTSIDMYAFYGCSGLTGITIPKGLNSIGKGAFYNCGGLMSINVMDGNPVYTSVNGVLFNKEKTQLIAFPGGKGGSYTVPSGVTEIGYLSFGHCESLMSITLPGSVTSIGDSAFTNCIKLTNIMIQGGVTSIGRRAFAFCDSLISIAIPESVTTIGDDAFYNSSLESIACTCTSYARAWAIDYGYDTITEHQYIIDPAVSVTDTEPGRTEGVHCERCGEVVTAQKTIPALNTLSMLRLPAGLRSIEEEAFAGLSAEAVIIPDRCTSIGSRAFADCPNLIYVRIPAGVTSIADDAFEGSEQVILDRIGE